MEGGDTRADVFLDNINRLFHFEREYDREMITDEERTRRRQGLQTLEAMINLRAVRPFTTKRKNSLHFGSDEGAEIAAVYHSIISTVKLQGRSTWNYLGKFFTGIFNGCRDFLSLSPQNIDLAVCQ